MNSDNNLVPKYRFPEFEDDGNWSTYAISEISEFRRGSFPQPYGLPEWYDKINGFPFIQVFDVDENLKLKPFTKNKISLAAANQSVFIKAGTLIVTLQGSIGRVAITQYDAYIDRTLLIFDDYKIDIDKYFYAYIIKLIFEIEKEKAPGGIIKTITKEVLSKFIVKIPTNPSEQQNIAACLSSLDDVIAGHEEKLTALEEHKKGLMQNLFPQEGETQPKYRFPEFENDRDWDVVPFSKYITLFRGSSPRPIVDFQTTVEDAVNWIKIGDTKNAIGYKLQYAEEKITHEGSRRSRPVVKGEIILANSMSYGKAYMLELDGCIYDGWFVLRNYEEFFDKNYLIQLLNSDYLQNQYKKLAAGGIVQNISSDIVYNTELFHTTKEEQQKIALVLSYVDDLIIAQREKIEALKAHKKGLMQGLFPKIES